MAIYKGDKRFILFDGHCIGEIQYVVSHKSKKLYSVHVYAKGGYSLEFSADELDKFKRANSIDELCDEFVLFYDNEATEPDLTYRGGFNDLYFQNELKHSTKIYGAIWTDKGLIYIASYDKTTGTFVPIDVGNI